MADGNESTNFSVVVLLFKAKNEDDAYEKALRAHGYQPVFIPVLSFQFINKEVIIQKLENPQHHCGLVVTSPRGVDAVYNCVTDIDFREKWESSLREKWLDIPVFVTGKATGKHVREKLNFDNIFGEESGNSESLSEIISNTLSSNPEKALLFPCANIKKETLPKILEQRGYLLCCVTAYCTTADPNLAQGLIKEFPKGQPGFIVFFSPSGVTFSHKALRQIFPLLDNIKFVAIGQTTHQGLLDNGFQVAGTAQKPDPPSLVEAIDSCLKQSQN